VWPPTLMALRNATYFGMIFGKLAEMRELD